MPSGKLKVEQLRYKTQANWNCVEVFCLIKTVTYNSFMLSSVKQTAVEPICVTVGRERAVTSHCGSVRSSVASEMRETHHPAVKGSALGFL